MTDLDAMDEAELQDILDAFASKGRHVAFAGSKVLSEGGLGYIRFPLSFGPELKGRRIATVGAPYTIPKEDLGAACCPHMASGTIEAGADDLCYQGVPVVMVGDRGTHFPSCGGKVGIVVEGWRKLYHPREIYAF